MSTVMPAVGNTSRDYRTMSKGRLRDAGATANERNYVIAMHLLLLGCAVSGAVGSVVLPIALAAMWLIKREDSRFIDDQGRELCNVLITGLICIALFPLLIPWVIITFINAIRGACAAGRGEYFRYPVTIRILS